MGLCQQRLMLESSVVLLAKSLTHDLPWGQLRPYRVDIDN